MYGSDVVVVSEAGEKSSTRAWVASSEPAHPVAADAPRLISVLLVEDDEDARRLVTQTLEYYGAQVLPAASASEAVQLLEQHHADVLLSDLRMPGEDGFALIHNLRSRRDSDVASIPVASITASRLTEDRHHAIAAGYQLHLQKPVDPDELVSAMLMLASMPRDGQQMH